MVNYSQCQTAEIIRHIGENTFYFPITVKGYSEQRLFPVFPDSIDDEIFIKFYDNIEDWEAFSLAEAQRIHRKGNATKLSNILDDCFA